MDNSLQQAALFDVDNDIITGWEGDDDVVIPFQYTLTSYGADYPVIALVSQLNNGDIFIPSFQRSYVWNQKEASKFIETLLLGLPVPGVFFSKEYGKRTHLVIDGQQRLRTLQYFCNGIFEPSGEIFALTGVQKQFEGLTYKTLSDEDRRMLDNSIIHLTIVQQDHPSDDDSSIYLIFERLNTTGRALSSQEIRACLYHGAFNQLLVELNKNHHWRQLFGKSNQRMRDQELILRFLALYFFRDKYSKPMKGFLNKYMKSNRDLKLQSEEKLSEAFVPTVEMIAKSIGEKAFRPKRSINAAVMDAVMIGIAQRLSRGPITDLKQVQTKYQLLLDNDKFIEVYEVATTDELNIATRINLAIDAFADLT